MTRQLMKNKIFLLLLILLPLQSYSQHSWLWEADKKLHLEAGAFLGTWATFAGSSCNWSPEQSALFGMSFVTGIGALKEGVDALGYGTPEFKDFYATMIGGTASVAISYLALKAYKAKLLRNLFKKPCAAYAYTDSKNFQVGFMIYF